MTHHPERASTESSAAPWLVSHEGPDAAVSGLCRLLERCAAPPFVCGDFSLPAVPPELVLQVVGPAQVGAALAQLAALRREAMPCAVLVAALGLDGDALARLLAAGAGDFVRAPFDADEAVLRARQALERGPVEPAEVVSPQAPPPPLRGLIGSSPAFVQQVSRIPLLARYDASVLILGDTGTGKELCAQAIHYLSPRAGRPWVAVNCGAIPAELIEAELFGHVKGAFTHAHCARAGLVREAEGGTLFLDEIDALPHGAQAKLLRFLQEKEYRAVGANAVQRADVRVIAATNRHPALLASREVFRQDLLFRLNVLTLQLPRLRDRTPDIAPLALYFLRGAAQQWDKPVPMLSPAALHKLVAHHWPGNVRELRNVMERALLLSTASTLGAAEIELDGDTPAPPVPAAKESFRAAKARVVENFERSYIEQLLASSGGNVTQAALAAKKNRRAFFELMRKYRIDSDPFRQPARDA